jgi:Cu-Zn family superoxide dismutase
MSIRQVIAARSRNMTRLSLSLAGALAALATPAFAATAVVPMALATPTGPGAGVGTVTVRDAPGGVVLVLDLHGLPPGPHGFHVHSNPSCAPGQTGQAPPAPAGAAGGHLDPAMTGMHMGPEGKGHLGDLPVLAVADDQSARQTLKAPRIASVADLKGRALMIHAGGDNYADAPAPLGGGGARLACGVIP